MILYRIADDRYANDLNGTGGLFAPGRWHHQGMSVVYLAGSISLAILEVLVHSPSLPQGRSLVTVSLPDKPSILDVDIATLPERWQDWPYLDELPEITAQWLREGKFWIMRVPSAPSPTEYKYLLNPRHPEHKTLALVSIEPHPFDPRLK